MKFVLLIFSTLIFVNFSISQEANIETIFIKKGDLLDKPGPDGLRYTQYRKGDKCIVLEYFKGSYYKVKYKKWVGFVSYYDLKINDELENLVIEFNRSRKQKIETERRVRDSIEKQEKIKREIIKANKLKEEKIKDSLRLIELNIRDSIAKIKRRKNCHYTLNEIDEFTNKRVITTEYYTIASKLYNNYYFMIKLKRIENSEYIFFALDDDLGCTSPYKNSNSSVKIKLENNDIITFYHVGDINCGEFELIGKLTNSDKSRLLKSPIKTIRLNGTDYYEDIKDFDYSDFFFDKLKCLNTE
ncbi:hypothetical protein [Gaetbulibacter sp. PBL-D1]|uniref:hypothetical protein n=1 Tax=Gaetbulibacter sp. PBL-D1 TaxID=3422594 RepID=UPI003D2F3185